MISKRQAKGIQHLIGQMMPDHPKRYQLTPNLAQELVSELADMSAEKLGTGIDGEQVSAEMEHRA